MMERSFLHLCRFIQMIQNKQITENAWVNNLCVSCNRLIIGSIQKTGELCIKFGLYYKLVYICIGAKEDCAASLGRKTS